MAELSERDFDRIERFVLGEMSPKEEGDFQKEIDSNGNLRETVQEQLDLMDAVSAEGLKAELESIHSELYHTDTKKSNRPLLMSIAAAVAVLIGFSFWYFGQDQAGDLYAEHSYTDPGLPVPMSATDSYDFYDAMVDYKTEDYATAIDKWEKLLKAEPENDTLNYYIGAAHFNDKAFDEALSFLRKVSADEASPFKFKAHYMIFLSALQSGKENEARDFAPMKDSPFTEAIEAAKESIGS